MPRTRYDYNKEWGMDSEFLFIEFCAVVCVVTLAFRARRILRRRMGNGSQHSDTSARFDHWYCFFNPRNFHRSPALRKAMQAQSAARQGKAASRPRARMSCR
ncbi:hypothetical protein JCM16814_34370 [Desulfobaculum senezii]